MRRWLRLTALLYPRSWRRRYSEEFEALLENVKPVWSDVFDVLRGAISMQTRSLSTYWKPFIGIAAAGGLMALAASFAVPGTYVSSTVIHTDSPERATVAWDDVTSRSSLAEVIQRPTLNLYPRERNQKPLEDVIEDMRRDLKLVGGQGDGSSLRVSFSYADRNKAQEVVKCLTARMLDAVPVNHGPGTLPTSELRVLVPATLPETPTKPDRAVYMSLGLGAGLLLGLLVALLRSRAKWTVTVVTCGLAGATVAGALSLLIPNRYTAESYLRVLPLPAKDGSPRYLTDAEMSIWLQQKQRDVVTDESLAEIIQRKVLDLYSQERDENSLAGAIKSMRRDLHIAAKSHSTVRIWFTYPDRFKAQLVAGAISNQLLDSAYVTTVADLFHAHPARKPATIADCAGKVGGVYFACIESLPTIEFSAASPPKRQATRRELISLIDPASLPATPVSPNRYVLAIAGLLVGLFLGACRWGTGTPMPLHNDARGQQVS